MTSNSTATWSLLLLFLTKGYLVNGKEKELNKGKHIAEINSYHHQVSGDVYAVDEYTFLLSGFNYDGNGADTFFWAGATNRPGPQGFIVPNEHGRTNVLKRYFNKDFTLTLPDGKKITEIKWFAVYDLTSQNAFGDVYIPEDFEPPTTQRLSQIAGKSNNISSDPVAVLDSKTIKIPKFSYDGLRKSAYFWVGIGPQPVSKGIIVPDENGYLNPIRAYKKEDVTLQLPGDLAISEISWFSIFDVELMENLGSILIPEELNVPPSLIKVVPYKNKLPNCIQLHKNLQIGWEVFGPQITFQLAGQVAEDDYMAFGLSGSRERSEMLNSDITIAYIESHLGHSKDYNVTAKAPCVRVLGQYKGVCRDELVGGIDNNQLHSAVREDGINIVTYRRTLISSDHGDQEYKTEGSSYVIWAMGKLDHNKEPSFHDFYLKGDLKIEFGTKENVHNCFSFTTSQENFREPWEINSIFDRTIRTFTAVVGPSGGKRGYQGITGMTTSSGLAWYINGKLVPELWLRRGLTYVFKVRGGNNPHSTEFYHPLIITDEPHGGFERLSDEAQKHIRVLAGVEFTRRGQPKPTAAGPLCVGKHSNTDRRLDDDFPTFRRFNRSLTFTCENGEAALLEVTPNSSWPDFVYYNSFTHSNMGWKIHIVDTFSRSNGYQKNPQNFMLLSSLIFFIKYFLL